MSGDRVLAGALLALLLGTGAALAQAVTPAAHVRRPRHRRVAAVASRATGRTQTIPRETAPPSPPQPDISAAQRAADSKLLQQEQARSAHDAAVTDQIVRTAQQQHDAIEREVRINDTVPNQPQAAPVPVPVPVPPER
jgi:hypothetical protein